MPRIRAENIEAHKELTRADILSAAYDLLEELGSADISLAEVAHQVGIGRTTLYEYFRDRDDLIASLVEDRLPGVEDEILSSIPGGIAADERVERLAKATVHFVVEDRVLGLILHRELPRLSREAQMRVRTSHESLAAEMVIAFQAGVEAGLFRPMPPDVAGRLIHDVIMSAARIVISSANPPGRFAEVSDAMAWFLLNGLRKGSADGGTPIPA